MGSGPGISVEIVAVHPAVTIIRTDSGQQEIPTGWFTTVPKIGQRWELALNARPALADQYEQLNRLLRRD